MGWFRCRPGFGAAQVLLSSYLTPVLPPAPQTQICAALQKAALDPRIKGVAVEIGPVAAGWAKVQEIRRWVQEMHQWGVGAVQHRH